MTTTLNPWQAHLARYQKAHPTVNFGDAMTLAKPSYRALAKKKPVKKATAAKKKPVKKPVKKVAKKRTSPKYSFFGF